MTRIDRAAANLAATTARIRLLSALAALEVAERHVAKLVALGWEAAHHGEAVMVVARGEVSDTQARAIGYTSALRGR